MPTKVNVRPNVTRGGPRAARENQFGVGVETYRRVGHDSLELFPERVDRLKALADGGDVLDIAVQKVEIGHAPPEGLQGGSMSISRLRLAIGP